jgi:hypothetical protein
MRLLVALVALIGACGRQDVPPPHALEAEDPAQFPDEPPIPEEIVIEAEPEWTPFERDLMFWLFFRIARGPAFATEVQLRLEEGSRLKIKRRGRWQAVTLDGLVAHLDRAKELFDEKRRAQGKSGYDTDPLGGRQSGLFVDLDLHPRSPWQHLGWLVTVFLEQQIYKLQVRAGDRTLHLFLFWDRAIEYTSPPPHTHIKVQVEAKGTRVAYRVDGKPHRDLRSVTEKLKKAMQRAEARKKADLLVGDPVIPSEMPVEHALSLFFAFLDTGIPRLDFGLAIPSDADRAVEVLPDPVMERR